MTHYRKANLSELPNLKTLLWKHGPNEWNYLTPAGVDDEFALIECARADAVVALEADEIVGMAVLIDGTSSPDYLNKYANLEHMSFIGDVVVSAEHSGKGIATQLLNHCLDLAKNKGAKSVLIERHEENLASAGMMKKAGFSIVDTFHDPQKRSAGSQNSVILAIHF
ncbi:GNAT family N-acetyltransferase [Pseudoalteromonas obscura]|uniref:GNAT family N-acetyltransferase n=1 Tax=Pseudoalteromonas obscura TaxID=3048491 RepID=A0ABT7EJX3_9GAMM|nr:GNAT family N-acetyltransferase [Pseudoalteromonas sp. P94(2023)]MDK2595366.1 GNAT family N-acetyltransferase [Pseudoalteromonas sp. P94(2023)]